LIKNATRTCCIDDTSRNPQPRKAINYALYTIAKEEEEGSKLLATDRLFYDTLPIPIEMEHSVIHQ